MSCGRSFQLAGKKCDADGCKTNSARRGKLFPRHLVELMSDKDPAKSQRVFKAMLQMTKIDIEGLKRAYRGD